MRDACCLMNIVDWNNWTFRLLRLDSKNKNRKKNKTMNNSILYIFASQNKRKNKLDCISWNLWWQTHNMSIPTMYQYARMTNMSCFLFYSNLWFIWQFSCRPLQNKTKAPGVRTNIGIVPMNSCKCLSVLYTNLQRVFNYNFSYIFPRLYKK